MKNVLLKDTFREIRKSFGRFISIFAIVTLGVAFFAGINAAAPDMRITADTYYDDYNFMDFRLLSTLGFDENDVDEIRKAENIEGIFPTNSMDVLTTIDNNEIVVKIHALPKGNLLDNNENYINRPKIVSGRLPENPGECVIEKGNIGSSDVPIGSKLVLTSGREEDISKSLKMNEFTVVGIVESPYYLTFEKGTSDIGNGKVSKFIMISEEDMNMDYYTEIFLTVKGAKSLNSFEKKYEDFILPSKESLEEIADKRKEVRYEEILSEANRKLDESIKEYEDNKSKVEKDLEDAKNKIESSKIEIATAENTLNKNKSDFYIAIKDGKQKIQDGENSINKGEEEYNKNLAEFENTKKYVMEQISLGEKKLEDNEGDLKLLEGYILEMKKTLDSGNVTGEELEKLKKDISEAETQLNEGREKLKYGQVEIEKNKQMLIDGENKLKEAKVSLTKSKESLENEKLNLSKIEAETLEEFKKAEADIEDGKSTIKIAEEELIKGREEAESKFREAKNKIDEAKIKINDIKEPKWYVLDRNSNYSFVDYGGSADRITAIAKVFPLFFFLVAALVCLTTMTRMVDEQRINIGTLKALGYGKWAIASKYILYAAFASIGGSISGIAIGFIVFPKVIFDAYSILYSLPPVILKFNVVYASIAMISAVSITTLAAFLACNKDLIEVPSLLMKPKAPKEGKRILLERVPFIWNRFDFSKKVTARNIFRYKKRFFMTVIGISGCTALLLSGFGIKDSIKAIVEKQFGQVYKYDMTIGFDSDTSIETQKEIMGYVSQNGEIENYTTVKMKNSDVSLDENKESVTIIVPKEKDEFSDFIKLETRKHKERINIEENGIILTEKAAKELKVKSGDTVYINKDENEKIPVKITGITEQYVMNYVYMSENLYKEIFNEEITFNEVLARLSDKSKEYEEKLSSDILKEAKVTSVNFNSVIENSFEDTISSLNYVVLVMIVSAGALAFVVLYNLTNVNISERIREIATIKVLGFYDNEVSAYVYRENFVLTAIGTISGLGLGVLLHRFIMITAEPANIMFGRNIEFMSFIYSSILTFVFSAIVNFVMYFKLKKTPMIESLKSVD